MNFSSISNHGITKNNPYQCIVMISDGADLKNIDELSTDLDKTQRIHEKELKQELEGLFEQVKILRSPKELIRRHIEFDLKNTIVFPNWNGADSRNNYSLIPSICESLDLHYIGGDAFMKLLCMDKALVKPLFQQAGFLVPNFSVAYTMKDLKLSFKKLSFPLVIKPLWRNASIGITPRSLVRNEKDAMKTLDLLLTNLNEPAIVEEFIPGKEVTISIISNSKGFYWASCERYVPGQENYFGQNLFDFTIKKKKVVTTKIRSINEILTTDVKNDCINLLKLLGKTDYLRLDFKYYSKKLYLIEASPTPLLHSKSDFIASFLMNGMTYRELLIELFNLTSVKPCVE